MEGVPEASSDRRCAYAHIPRRHLRAHSVDLVTFTVLVDGNATLYGLRGGNHARASASTFSTTMIARLEVTRLFTCSFTC